MLTEQTNEATESNQIDSHMAKVKITTIEPEGILKVTMGLQHTRPTVN